MGTYGQNSQSYYQRYISCYLLWLVLSGLGFWLILQIRINLMELAVVLQVDRWLFLALHNWSMVVLGILWLSFTVSLEAYLRKGIKKHDLWLRGGRTFNILLLLLLGSYLLQRLVIA